MQRKRRNRGNWFPLLGHIEADDAENEFAFSDNIILNDGLTQVPISGVEGGIVKGPFPLVPDFTPEAQNPTVRSEFGVSLHDRVTGQAWLLQRIVGKLNFACHPDITDDGSSGHAWDNIFLKIGIFVARASDDNQGQADLGILAVAPMGVDNAMDPWIFQRSWILGNALHQTVNGFVPKYPTTTAGYLGANTGTHIDSKVKRFISREHRLFCIVEARGWDGNHLTLEDTGGTETIQPGFSGLLDLRIYGTVRKAHNSSSF